MVGSGGDRSTEAVGMMALHEALRTVCLTSDDWTYSVFWTIRPRPRIRGGNGYKVGGDDSGSLMLMWEDGFCRGRSEDLVRKSFGKMSIQLYNYGEGWVLSVGAFGFFDLVFHLPSEPCKMKHEIGTSPPGLMGKVASDKCHKWVFKEPTECEPNISNYWQSSFDALPSEWTEQFESGIQTIAVIQAGHGLLQLGSCKIIAEDLHFVLRMRHTFESLGHQSGFYLSQLFSSTRGASSSATAPLRQPAMPMFDWGSRPIQSGPSMLASPNSFHNSGRHQMPPSKDETHMFLLPHSTEPQMENIKWPNGLSFFSALTGRVDEDKLLFNPDVVRSHKVDPNAAPSGLHNSCGGPNDSNPNEFLSLDEHSEMEGKFKRSFTSPSPNSLGHSPGEYRNEYSNAMESFLE